MRQILPSLALSALLTLACHASPDISGCLGCHGADGPAELPKLAGMPALYVTNQLFMFREGQRTADPMNGLAEPMSDDALQAYAAAIAALPVEDGPPTSADPTRVARADAAIAKHRCASCHGATLGGDGGVPRLRGQHEAYLAATLRAYKTSDRAGFDPQMNEVAGELGDGEIADLAYALARR